jgi:hypothetical protein
MKSKLDLRELKRQVSTLNTRQLVRLDAWIHGLLESAPECIDDSRSTGTARPGSHKTYRRELVRCGKKGCKCADGQLHGPYWYAYWTEGGKTRSQYVGKRLPKGVRAGRKRRSAGSDNSYVSKVLPHIWCC